ncbi:MAG: hypothetical protein ABIB41_02225 [Nitrospirota bacterium]
MPLLCLILLFYFVYLGNENRCRPKKEIDDDPVKLAFTYLEESINGDTGSPENLIQDTIDSPNRNLNYALARYQAMAFSNEFERVLKSAVYTYDNALMLIAFLVRINQEDLIKAKFLADAMLYALDNDRYFTDGRLRNAYYRDDFVLLYGQESYINHGYVRMPGWWSKSDKNWLEDRYQVGTYTGNMAWAMLALLTYYEKVGGKKYLDAALQLGEWIENHTRDMRGAGGYTGGYDGWERTPHNLEGQTKIMWKSTEHNIDVYVAFARLCSITGKPIWLKRALHAKKFVEKMWDVEERHFWTGTFEDGITINKDNIPTDINTWSLMVLGDRYSDGMRWVENNCFTVTDGFKGFDFNNDRDGVWFEGTAHAVLAYKLLNEEQKAISNLRELERVQKEAKNADFKGIVAASHDGVSTGFDWRYYSRIHIGTTAWFIFAKLGYNPFWDIEITEPVPEYQ